MADTTTPQAIDLAKEVFSLKQAIQYLQDTRSDFEKNGPQDWISTLETQLSEASTALRDFEIQHIDDTVPYADPNCGEQYELLIRSVDPEGFDRVTALSVPAQQAFQNYFVQHLQLLQDSRGGAAAPASSASTPSSQTATADSQ